VLTLGTLLLTFLLLRRAWCCGPLEKVDLTSSTGVDGGLVAPLRFRNLSRRGSGEDFLRRKAPSPWYFSRLLMSASLSPFSIFRTGRTKDRRKAESFFSSEKVHPLFRSGIMLFLFLFFRGSFPGNRLGLGIGLELSSLNSAVLAFEREFPFFSFPPFCCSNRVKGRFLRHIREKPMLPP